MNAPEPAATTTAGALGARFADIRVRTLQRVEGLSAEDGQAQSMPEASRLKWQLAPTT